MNLTNEILRQNWEGQGKRVRKFASHEMCADVNNRIVCSSKEAGHKTTRSCMYRVELSRKRAHQESSY